MIESHQLSRFFRIPLMGICLPESFSRNIRLSTNQIHPFKHFLYREDHSINKILAAMTGGILAWWYRMRRTLDLAAEGCEFDSRFGDHSHGVCGRCAGGLRFRHVGESHDEGLSLHKKNRKLTKSLTSSGGSLGFPKLGMCRQRVLFLTVFLLTNCS